jgi:GNAT superfamily N-acetyltransferase
MNYIIRLANPGTEYDRVADLINTFERQVITADMLREWDSRSGEGSIHRRSVAVDESGQIVGYSLVGHDTWDKPGFFVLWVVVDPRQHGQGIGSLLYDEALGNTRGSGATILCTHVLDSDATSKPFAEKRGFCLDHHIFESTLDLHTFDESRFAGLVESVEAAGIHFFSLADAGDTREARHKLWEVNYQTVMDDPGTLGTFPDSDELDNIFNIATWFRPDGQILAADGDRYVGLGAVGHYKETNSAYNMMTGVLADYRGRKIAQALKLLGIRKAKSWGVDYIRTNNESLNAPMLAINQKLGYVPQPGLYRMINHLKG